MRSRFLLITTFLIIALLLCQQLVLAQTDLRIPKGNYQLKRILSMISANGYYPAYSANLLPIDSLMNVEEDIIGLKNVLDEIVQRFPITYEINGKQILFKANIIKRLTINGRVRDKSNGEVLIGANVSVMGGNEGVTTNAYGFYAISLPVGKYQLAYSYIGYKPVVLDIDLSKSTRADIELEIFTGQLEEILILSKKVDTELEEVHTGINLMDMSLMGQIPYLLGEVDIFQGALLMPGVRNIGEDASGLNIRGGSVDQNLILLDEATIYNSNHFYGLISVFNPDAVKDFTIYKGSVPSTYGGRISSTIHVRQKEGNDKEFHVSGGLGLVSSRLLLEGPIVKEKSSFLISSRSSFLSYLAAISSDPTISNSRYGFQDLNGKVNWRPNDKNHLYISGYLGIDNANDGILLERKWGNRTLTGRWNHLYSDRLFSNFTLVYSDYNYRVNNPDGIGQFVEGSTLSNTALKSDFDWYVSPSTQIEFGSGMTFHRLNPGDRRPIDENDLSSVVSLDTEHGLESYLYTNFQQKLSDRLTAYLGIRMASLATFGPDAVYKYEAGKPLLIENIVDTAFYKPAQIVKHYLSPEPRLSLIYNLGADNSIKVSYNRAGQFLHLISNTISPSPTDIWKLSDTHIKPTFSDQYNIGYHKRISDARVNFFIEAYFRDINNIIEYREGADLFFNENLETELLQGVARAYGLEFFARKTSDRFSGWFSYNLSRAERKIDGSTPLEKINNGDYYPADHDKTHDLSISGAFQANERWSLSSNFVFSTGRPITLPDGKYEFDGFIIPSFSDRNQFRLTNYHRLDFAAKLEGKKTKANGSLKRKTDFWTFTLYNVYSRRNAYSYLFRQQAGSDNTEVVKYSILGSIIPSVTYNFKF